MNALILGGQSPRHYDWVRRVAEALKPHLNEVQFLDYRHWQNDAPVDLEYEISQASRLVTGMGNEYVIVAKSLGTMVATHGDALGLLHPSRCVFLGLPLKAFDELPDMPEGLKRLPPTVFVQNTRDPLGSFADVQTYVAAHSNAEARCLETPGDTHDYADFTLITELATGER